MFARTILSDDNPISTDNDPSSPGPPSSSPSKWASYGPTVPTVDPQFLQPQAKKRKVIEEEDDEIDEPSSDEVQIG